MRLLLCTPRFAPQLGGAETWTREVSLALARAGHEITVVARPAAGCPPRHALEGIDVVRVAGGRGRFSASIASCVRSVRPDAVLAQYSALMAAAAASKVAAVPCLGIVHDVYGMRESVRLKGWRGGLARTFGLEQWLRVLPPDAFLVPSRATAAGLRGLARGRPVTVVPAGADHLSDGESVAARSERFVFVGRLVPQKGVDDIIEAASILRGRGRHVHVLVMGEGPHGPILRERARELDGAVELVGAVSDRRLDAEIRHAAALLLPSRREGWGLAVTEAASRATPYVAYDIPAVREQHDQLHGGLLVPPAPEALAEAIERLAEAPRLARELGERGSRATARMTWAAAGEVVERAIVQALRTRASQARRAARDIRHA